MSHEAELRLVDNSAEVSPDDSMIVGEGDERLGTIIREYRTDQQEVISQGKRGKFFVGALGVAATFGVGVWAGSRLGHRK